MLYCNLNGLWFGAVSWMDVVLASFFWNEQMALHGWCFGCWLAATAVGWMELVGWLIFPVASGFSFSIWFSAAVVSKLIIPAEQPRQLFCRQKGAACIAETWCRWWHSKGDLLLAALLFLKTQMLSSCYNYSACSLVDFSQSLSVMV